ncbi:MAG: NADH-quinone oxidoreductase subunit L, partial [Chloroflexi bacterium]|nr:NADH-quinone oxidoreductase subunit L [Chloroflexota bacterium]
MLLTRETAAVLVPLLPLAAFVLLGLGMRRYRKTAALVSVLAIATSFVLALSLLVRVAQEGIVSASLSWLRVGEVAWTVGLRVDPLAALMLVLVTSVSLAVQVYSLEYMKGEPRFGWYFAAHSLFAASMLGLVLTDSLLLLYISWELVGLCSFLLIGFWFEHRPAAEAAKKAFVTTRIGDVGLLIGVLLLFTQTGSFEIARVFDWAAGASEALVTVVVLLIFLGAMGKSAQVPFHVWLPDAMEGPTPVSALIHAATMVAAGVFLVARLYPLFLAAPAILWVVAVIGVLTALLAGLLALAEV